MQFQNSFDVEADPDAVYRFLLDVREVVTCVPGAELTEVAEGDTYEGRMKVKVGAIQTSYKGSASIVDRDQTARSATLKAKGRETTGAGAATMQASLSVTAHADRIHGLDRDRSDDHRTRGSVRARSDRGRVQAPDRSDGKLHQAEDRASSGARRFFRGARHFKRPGVDARDSLGTPSAQPGRRPLCGTAQANRRHLPAAKPVRRGGRGAQALRQMDCLSEVPR